MILDTKVICVHNYIDKGIHHHDKEAAKRWLSVKLSDEYVGNYQDKAEELREAYKQWVASENEAIRPIKPRPKTATLTLLNDITGEPMTGQPAAKVPTASKGLVLLNDDPGPRAA